ncbi:TRAP transporter large permease subunit [Yoonia sediminilitoris]|uniref:Tripartite ATP-independent transporter DctM subunit n=1 Tax=Yoonia sediminilitoris TaxID=1286148 RepID=A0A2T6KR01_9RHOB|nr:tripartite ATP-independent transporter DctM subunit [Yoonia sediminilitoris]RCW99156.1 tripartite ATP-independent transporter DctM subunit [Yoonia sediminilitoris]
MVPILPLIETYGFDLLWFGVVVIRPLEIGLITPPVGLNVFVIANAVGKQVPVGMIFAWIIDNEQGFGTVEIPHVGIQFSILKTYGLFVMLRATRKADFDGVCHL